MSSPKKPDEELEADWQALGRAPKTQAPTITVRRPPPLSNLPTRPSPAVLASSRQEPSDAPDPADLERESASGPQILVVDDDPAIREILVEILSESENSYGIWQARDGWDAMNRIFEMPAVDLILVDIWMPRVRGDEFLQGYDKFSATYHDDPRANAPVIIISAGEVPKDAGLDDKFVFMKKPLDLNTILATVHRRIYEFSERPPPPSKYTDV